MTNESVARLEPVIASSVGFGTRHCEERSDANRHCEPTGRRKAPPDDRLREAIHGAANEEWIASSLALLAMTATIFADHRPTDSNFQTARRVQTRLRGLAAAFARVLPEFRVL